MSIALLRRVALVEGLSCLALFLVAMPLKHVWDVDVAVRIVGSVHGALFLAFCAVLVAVALRRRWPMVRSALVLLSAVPPFGMFLADPHLRRWEEQERAAAAV